MSQTYANHVYRPTATALGGMFFVVALTGFGLRWFEVGGRSAFAIGLLGLCGSVAMLLAMSRLYITRLQDRIIRLEMRVRTASLLTPAQQTLLFSLPIKHVAALRFASDGELGALAERAVRERMKPADIKRAVTSWTPDLDRT